MTDIAIRKSAGGKGIWVSGPAAVMETVLKKEFEAIWGKWEEKQKRWSFSLKRYDAVVEILGSKAFRIDIDELAKPKALVPEPAQSFPPTMINEALAAANNIVEHHEALVTAVKEAIPFATTEKKIDDLSRYLLPDLNRYYEFKRDRYAQNGWLLWLRANMPLGAVCSGYAHVSATIPPRNDIPAGNTIIEYPISYSYDTPDIIYRQTKGWTEILECLKTDAKFTVTILSITTHPKPHKRKPGSHANALIFDHARKRITRFEPHGSCSNCPMNPKKRLHEESTHVHLYDSGLFDAALTKFFAQEIGDGWKYFGPLQLPTGCAEGPQARESIAYVMDFLESIGKKRKEKKKMGFCAAWSMLYIHYRLSNPMFTDEELLVNWSRLDDKTLTLMVRRYAAYVVHNVTK